jgi:hypothetical protein
MVWRVMTTVAVIVALAGCARRAPVRAGVPDGTPYVSWIIMHGDRENADAEFSCQSTEPAECVVPASRADAQVFSDVHVYYHGVGSETTYVGSYQVGFFQSATAGPQDIATRITVRGNRKITNESVMGIVTSKPGTYALRFSLDASMPGSTVTHPVREDVRVTVQ